MCCNENTVTIVDVTDPTDATTIKWWVRRVELHAPGLAHRGPSVLHEQRRLDEQDYGLNTTTFIWDVSDLSDPPPLAPSSARPAIDHNMYVLTPLCTSPTTARGCAFDLTDIENGEPTKWPTSMCIPRATRPNGSWSNYPYLPSGVIRCLTSKRACSS